jgi:hypothetical protein
MRYFLFQYAALGANGNLPCKCAIFPALKDLNALIKKETSLEKIVITGWNEFKSEQDYNDFLAL